MPDVLVQQCNTMPEVGHDAKIHVGRQRRYFSANILTMGHIQPSEKPHQGTLVLWLSKSCQSSRSTVS